MRSIRNYAAMLCRPYIMRELPAWGKVYGTIVGAAEADERWKGYDRIWFRGKFHEYEMSLDMGHWPNRATFFLGRYYDLATQLILKAQLKPGDTFIDIGANEGMISLLASSLVGPTGKVISFEPNPHPREIFQSNIDHNGISNINVFPCGLGDRDDVLEMTVPKINSGEGSFGKPQSSSGDVYTVQCRIARGDDLLRDEKPALIKIDVEGFELSVLNGLAETLSKSHPPVVMEMADQNLRNAGTSVRQVADRMTGLGYVPLEPLIKSRRRLCFRKWIVDDIFADILWVDSASAADFLT